MVLKLHNATEIERSLKRRMDQQQKDCIHVNLKIIYTEAYSFSIFFLLLLKIIPVWSMSGDFESKMQSKHLIIIE